MQPCLRYSPPRFRASKLTPVAVGVLINEALSQHVWMLCTHPANAVSGDARRGWYDGSLYTTHGAPPSPAVDNDDDDDDVG